MAKDNPMEKCWTVRGASTYETIGHVIEIGSDPKTGEPTVTCLSSPNEHTYVNGRFVGPDRIESAPYTITLDKQPDKNVITCKFNQPVGGSWTADDAIYEDG